ncbi:MAG: MATE family efflux transporter [Deltaproteobacteria bacterium]|nr:MAG: MATE family efflux transporter [Deltaproteobacteria bacterium]
MCPMLEEYKRDLKGLFLFALPLIAGQVGQMLFGTGDMMVAGRYSTTVVAALGVANAMMGPFVMIGLSITYAVGSLTAKARGEDKGSKSMLATSLGMSVIIGTFLQLILQILIMNLDLLKFDAERGELIATYLQWCGWSITPMLIFQSVKEYLQAHDDTFFANGSILGFLIFNVGLNIVLMFGMFGIPELGIKGAAIATTISRLLMAVALIFYAAKKMDISWNFEAKAFKEMIVLGIPIGLGTFVEVMVFTIVTVLVGKMTTVASASHNIVLNLASLTFMVPLAMNSAAGVKVAYEFGKRSAKGVLTQTLAALTISGSFMLMTALIYFFAPTLLLKVFTDDKELITYASGLIIFVAMFQLPDGIQVTLWGVLRGLGKTKTPMLITLLGNWMIGLPLGYYLAFHRGMEAAGLWAGLAAGLSSIGVALSILFSTHYKGLAAKFAEHQGPVNS